MKKIMYFCFSIFVLMIMTGCAAQAFEKEINVVFMYENELISYDTVTQFKNIKSPELSDAYIPDGYKFFGWTALDPNKIKATDEDFATKYVGAGKIVHYSDVNEYVENTTVIMQALMIDKTEIPVPYHYVVIAWYDKVATSGLDSNKIEVFQTKLFEYLRKEGVTEDDINSIVIRGYTGNVGTSCGQIMNDEDVDLMFGWSSASNVTSTGGMPEAMLKETITDYKVGEKNRTIHRISEKETAKFVLAWMQTEECRSLFA